MTETLATGFHKHLEVAFPQGFLHLGDEGPRDNQGGFLKEYAVSFLLFGDSSTFFACKLFIRLTTKDFGMLCRRAMRFCAASMKSVFVSV